MEVVPDRTPTLPRKATFSFDGVKYVVTLDSDKLEWTRESGKARKHVVKITQMLGAAHSKEKNGFHVFYVSAKDHSAQGSRTLKTVSFDPKSRKTTKEEFEEICTWVEVLNQLVDQHRNLPKDKKLLVLVNPHGGKGLAKEIWDRVQKLFKVSRVPHELVVTTHSGHGKELASKISPQEYYGIVTVSGDGLLNEVLNGLLNREDYKDAIENITLGIIPGGSGNGLAGSIDVPDPETAAFSIISNHKRPLDIFEMVQDNKKHWGFLGIEWANLAVIDLESEDYRWLGPLRFDIKGLAKVMDCDSYKGKISFRVENWDPKNPGDLDSSDQQLISPPGEEHPGPYVNYFDAASDTRKWKTIEDKFAFFYAGNVTKVMTSPGPLCNHAKLSDGNMDLLIIRDVSRADLARAMLSIEDGTFTSLPFVEYYKTKAFILEPDLNVPKDQRAPIGLDGEHTANTTIKVQVHQALANFFYDYPHH